MENQLPDFGSLLKQATQAAIDGLRREMQLEARANASRLGLVRSGALLRSLGTRVRGRRVQLGTSLDYPNIYNFGGTVRQRTATKPQPRQPRRTPPTGTRVFDVRRRQFFGDAEATTCILRAERGVGRALGTD